MGNWLTGHLNIGKKITVYGRNAMHWGVTIRTKKYGYVCFRLPLRCFGRWYPLYLYFSPNATPWASTFMLGKKHSREDYRLAKVRRERLGHNFYYDSEFDANGNYAKLREINDKS